MLPPMSVRDSARCALGLAALGVALFLASCGPQEPSGREVAPSAASSSNALVSAEPKPELAKVVGEWVRPDGGYVLRIEKIDGAGKMEVRYLNPRPIHVARAEGRVEDGTAKVFVELWDEGYPGCTYSLAHRAGDDQLVGVYYQAAMKQSYQVTFDRMK
jgi:hypothetical protein